MTYLSTIILIFKNYVFLYRNFFPLVVSRSATRQKYVYVVSFKFRFGRIMPLVEMVDW